MRLPILLLPVITLFHGCLAVHAEPVVLADKGAAKLPIVIPAGAAPEITTAAADLARFLEQISGAKFSVTETPQSRGIFVGTAKDFPVPRHRKDLEIRDTFDGIEAYVIRTAKDSLHLVGATPKGASHAVFAFLEQLGCRWFFPAPEWEVIPTRERLVADLEIADRPKVLARRIWYGYGFFDRAQKRTLADYDAWARRNRMGESLRPYTGHAWQAIILANKQTFAEHPEYHALVKGKRGGWQLCVSNPAVRRLATEWALKRIAEKPELDMVSMECSDGLGQCECPACAALGGIPDRIFGLANEVARAVARRFPGKMVGMLAYSEHCEPPSFPLEPNVYVQSTAGFIRGRYTFEELMKLWPEKTRNLGFYEYFSVWLWDFDRLPGGKAADVRRVTERFRQYAALGATSITCESGNNWGPHGRGYYVANRVMWNPDADVAGLLRDFYEQAFGPAAAVMERYYERFDPGNAPLMSEHLIGLGLRDLREAAELARARPDVLARLEHLKQYLHYVCLRWDIDHLQDANRRKELTLAALTWCYRTRYSYMNHWAGMQYTWTKDAAKDFNEPSWVASRENRAPPWMVETPVTRAETERLFAANLARFQPQEFQEMKFSADLIWPQLPNPAIKDVKLKPLNQRFQRPKRYALFSRAGEPLEFAIETGVIKGYRNNPDARWTVSDGQGVELATGRLPQDGGKHPLTVKVPAKGLYWLKFEDSGAGWRIEAAADAPLSLEVPPATPLHHLGQFQEPVFFFVPRGLKQLTLYWEGGTLKPRLHDSTGRLVAEIGGSGRYVTFAVPDGTDGQAWFLTRFAPRQFWLANAPNYLAASPATLLVPREAWKD